MARSMLVLEEEAEQALCAEREGPEAAPAAPAASAGPSLRKLGVGVAVASLCVLAWQAALVVQRSHGQPVQEVPALQVANGMGAQGFLDLFELDGTALRQGGVNSSLVRDILAAQRHLQDMTQNPLALPIATCTVDVYLVASFIGILGNIITGTVKACRQADNLHTFVDVDRFKDLLKIDFLTEERKQQILSLLDQGCRIGEESSMALFSFTAAFLARAASDCATSMKLPPNPSALCAADMSLLVSAVAYMAAGAETAEATCPPFPLGGGTIGKDLVNVESLDIVGALARRLSPAEDRSPRVQAKLDDARRVVLSRLPSLGPLGGFILNNKEWLKIRRKSNQNQKRTEKLVKCGFDVSGLVGFAAAVGVFITAGTVECPLATGDGTEAEPFKMGCSLDISAVVAALTSIGGFVGILATECPKEPDTPAKNLCATGSLQIVSSLAFLSAAFSDVKRSCGAVQL